MTRFDGDYYDETEEEYWYGKAMRGTDFYGYRHGEQSNRVVAEQRRNVSLNTLPHYTDERFKEPQVVFGREKQGLFWNYSDRLATGNYSKHEEACRVANESGHASGSADWYEAYLSAYHDKKVALFCVKAGYNTATLFPYAIFFYGFGNDE